MHKLTLTYSTDRSGYTPYYAIIQNSRMKWVIRCATLADCKAVATQYISVDLAARVRIFADGNNQPVLWWRRKGGCLVDVAVKPRGYTAGLWATRRVWYAKIGTLHPPRYIRLPTSDGTHRGGLPPYTDDEILRFLGGRDETV